MAQKVPVDQQTRDLSKLVAERVTDAMISVLQLCETTEQSMPVAIAAISAAVANASGVVSERYSLSIEDAHLVTLELLVKQAQTVAKP